MANRLLPFRQYNEHFVINLFSLDLSGADLTTFKHDSSSSGAHDAGALVKLGSADWAAGEPAGYGSDGKGDSVLNAYLGKTDYPHVARNVNPAAAPKFSLHGGGAARPVGVTLNQTLAFDENGEKMLYYRQKLLEHQGVLPGEVVPVLTKGIITVGENGFDTGGTYSAGSEVFAIADGKFGSAATGFADPVGYVVGVGDRNDANGPYDANSPDYFAGDGDGSGAGTGKYLIINLDL